MPARRNYLARMLEARQVPLRDVRYVVSAAEFGGPDRLEKLYEWHGSRLGDIAKGIAGAIGGLLTTDLVTFVTQGAKVHVAAWEYAVFAARIVFALTYAAFISWRWARLPGEYASSLALFKRLARHEPNSPWKPTSARRPPSPPARAEPPSSSPDPGSEVLSW
jgi:hypothetical protein